MPIDWINYNSNWIRFVDRILCECTVLGRIQGGHATTKWKSRKKVKSFRKVIGYVTKKEIVWNNIIHRLDSAKLPTVWKLVHRIDSNPLWNSSQKIETIENLPCSTTNKNFPNVNVISKNCNNKSRKWFWAFWLSIHVNGNEYFFANQMKSKTAIFFGFCFFKTGILIPPYVNLFQLWYSIAQKNKFPIFWNSIDLWLFYILKCEGI